MNSAVIIKALIFLNIFYFPDPPEQPADVRSQLPERGVERHGESQDRSLRPEGGGGRSGSQRK